MKREHSAGLILLTALVATAGMTVGVADAAQQDQWTERVSVSSAGGQADNGSSSPTTSTDGRFVAFESFASNLVPGDTNGTRDVFVRDRTGTTERVSVSSASEQANHWSRDAAISGDGRYVAFSSEASNLVLGDTNFESDVFLHDRQTGTTERVSVDSQGVEAIGVLTTFSASLDPAISADGRYVAFQSYADNLVAGDLNREADVFVHDRQTGATERMSVSSAGVEADGAAFHAAISGDGRYVAFASAATNLVPGDTNESDDVFVHDRQTGVTERASVTGSGGQADGGSFEGVAISGDGRYVAFASGATNLVPRDTNGRGDVFVRDRTGATTERVSVTSNGRQANDFSFEVAISDDGRNVAFRSYASNLVPGDTNGTYDVFVHDRQAGVTQRVSVDSSGRQANDGSYGPAISGDGHHVSFYSVASNLVIGDTNNGSDVFVRFP